MQWLQTLLYRSFEFEMICISDITSLSLSFHTPTFFAKVRISWNSWPLFLCWLRSCYVGLRLGSRVCVYRLNRRKTSSLYYIIYGRGQRDLQLWPLPTKLHTGDQVNVPACPALGAFKTQLGGHNIFFAVVLYCHCPLWSIYIYRILIRLLSNLHVSGFGSCRII